MVRRVNITLMVRWGNKPEYGYRRRIEKQLANASRAGKWNTWCVRACERIVLTYQCESQTGRESSQFWHVETKLMTQG